MAINIFDLIANKFQQDPVERQRDRFRLGPPPMAQEQSADISGILAQIQGITNPVGDDGVPARPRLVPPSQPMAGDDPLAQPDTSTRLRLAPTNALPPMDTGGMTLPEGPRLYEPGSRVNASEEINAKPSRDNMLGSTPMERERNWLGVLTDPNNKVKNKGDIDPITGQEKKAGWKGRLKDALREAGLGALQGAAQGGLGGAIGGAIAGGVAGGIDPSQNEKRQRRQDIADTRVRLGEMEEQSKADIALQTAKLKAQGQMIQNSKDLRDLQGDPYWKYIEKKEEITQTDADTLELMGYPKMSPASWKKYKETVVNGQPFIRPENDPNYAPNPSLPVDPTEVPRDVNIDGQTMPMTPKQAGPVIATIAGRNATAEQQASTTNASNAIRVQQENVNNQIQHQTQVMSQINAALSADNVLSANASVQGLNGQIQAKNRELQALVNEPVPAGVDAEKAQKDRIDRINKLTDDINGLSGKLFDEVGKTEAGQAKAAALRASMPKPPPKLTYKPVNATKVGASVPAKKDPLGLFK